MQYVIQPLVRAATGRSLAGAVCVCVKYIVYCITLDRTCTDTLNQPRARLARLGRLHWISVYTLAKDPTHVSHRLICADVHMQSLCPRLWVSLAGRNYPPMSVTRACLAPARNTRQTPDKWTTPPSTIRLDRATHDKYLSRCRHPDATRTDWAEAGSQLSTRRTRRANRQTAPPRCARQPADMA